ncbi:MAG TPA: hypothetical protein GX694_00575 [Actinomycetales bacterium]|nr:hypothetical protein [Actinomycetales bacterium]
MTLLRTAGIGLLGLLGGVLFAIVAQDVLATTVIGDSPVSAGLAVTLATLTPVCALLGMVTAIGIDRGRRRRTQSPRADDGRHDYPRIPRS